MADVTIGVPVYGRLDLAERALRAIDRYTPPDVAVIALDDCGPQRLTSELVAAALVSGRSFELVLHERNRGFVGSVNHLFELAGRSDVVVVNSDVEVLPGWLDGLRAAMLATSDKPVASASSLADNGGILSVPGLGAGLTVAQLEQLRAGRPAAAGVPVAVAHCTWFARAAVERIGGFDQRFAPGYGEEVDWSLRAAAAGFAHHAALHSFVLHQGSASFGDGAGLLSLQRRHEALLLWRYRRAWFEIRRFARNPDTELAVVKKQIATYLSGVKSDPDGPPSTHAGE